MTTIIVISLIVFAIHYTMQEGEIFGFLGGLFSRLPKFMHNPLFDCPVCMTPWYGVPLYLLLFPGTIDVLQIAVSVVAAMGLNAVILKLAPDKESPTIHKELQDIADQLKLDSGVQKEFLRIQKYHMDKAVMHDLSIVTDGLRKINDEIVSGIKTKKIKATGKPKIHKGNSGTV